MRRVLVVTATAWLLGTVAGAAELPPLALRAGALLSGDGGDSPGHGCGSLVLGTLASSVAGVALGFAPAQALGTSTPGGDTTYSAASLAVLVAGPALSALLVGRFVPPLFGERAGWGAAVAGVVLANLAGAALFAAFAAVFPSTEPSSIGEFAVFGAALGSMFLAPALAEADLFGFSARPPSLQGSRAIFRPPERVASGRGGPGVHLPIAAVAF